jgi:hypothetical protein
MRTENGLVYSHPEAPVSFCEWRRVLDLSRAEGGLASLGTGRIEKAKEKHVDGLVLALVGWVRNTEKKDQ